ncbi:hypothetical protein JOM56_015146 [Amanita muscaria]
MPFAKRLKHLNNLGGWATFNSKKHKQEHLEEQESESTHPSPKKARQEPANPNPEHVLRIIPMPAPDNEAENAAMATDDNFPIPATAENRSENATLMDVVDMGDDDEEQEQVEFQYEKIGTHRFVPTIAEAEAAFEDIKQILKPSRKKAALRLCESFCGSMWQETAQHAGVQQL